MSGVAEMHKAKLVDRSGSLERMGGDVDLYRHMIDMFLEDSPRLISTITQDTNRDKASRAAHSLAGLASNFGASVVVDLARRIEVLPASVERGPLVAELTTMLDRLNEELRVERTI